MSNYCTPKEITQNTLEIGLIKSKMDITKMVLLGVLAGAYIGFGAEGSTMATHDIPILGLSRFLGGAIFATGLMMVIICGAELFTGNVLITIGVLERRVSVATMLQNWFWVYGGNLVGSLLVAYFMYASNLWSFNNSLHGAYVLKIAVGKVSLTFYEAFIRGIMCNWLVCLAVWMAYSAKDIAGKVLGIFFPIMLFVTSNFEHSVANMYYLAAGLLAKNVPALAEASHLGAKLNTLNLETILLGNLLPVTLGNIVGGALFVGSYYWFCYLRNPNIAQITAPDKNETICVK
ncbi:formate/nitrite transporter family protein [Sporomusa sp.]|uniref:formate/nitrite transporter family protein n=1 Tax=Sporomusa sp. TaxID=2078658 RepID=UPI002CE61325|nr:formate/nitrite transporter family protein [Sporomusa sp.]HWR07069.1 formate/nitrite transporter family protein [Sporomusa sp.]